MRSKCTPRAHPWRIGEWNRPRARGVGERWHRVYDPSASDVVTVIRDLRASEVHFAVLPCFLLNAELPSHTPGPQLPRERILSVFAEVVLLARGAILSQRDGEHRTTWKRDDPC
ncbi:hypothetical protein TcBrA4_0062310 [Trypanosoma cruzi]|nr:hypothetical protein TcBrA4_0062310 [Trypanosoma cruzi]